MVEMLLSAVPFGDVKHTGDAILRASKQQLAGYGVGQYECSFTAAGTEMRLPNESDKTTVRVSPSQAQVDQLEEWLLEKPIPYISNDNFSQEDIFDYWNGKLSGHAHVWTRRWKAHSRQE